MSTCGGLAWTVGACLVSCVFASFALIESPVVPLIGVVGGLAVLGGILRALASASLSLRGTQKTIAACALGSLVLVGVGHHPGPGLTAVALLALTSPRTSPWTRSRRARH